MNKNEIVINVIKAWQQKSNESVFWYESEPDLIFHEGLRNYPNIKKIIHVSNVVFFKSFAYDKIVSYVMQHCKGITPYLNVFRRNDNDIYNMYYIFDTIAVIFHEDYPLVK